MRTNADVTQQTFPFKTKLLGDFNRSNVLAALAVTVSALGVDKTAALSTVSRFRGVPGRLEVLMESPYIVVIDFAHTPNAIFHALKTVRTLTKKRLIHVFGSAGLRDAGKRPMMGAASAKFSDLIILTEEDYRTENVQTIMDEIASGIPKNVPVHRFADRARAIDNAFAVAQPGDAVVITGKSHEKSLCRGRTEYPWDEKAQVLRSFREKIKGT
jgi:UDP-N-acetylmuramoyl-L-alanyl-D-glutamate--2,6-diaminopimelate ligase